MPQIHERAPWEYAGHHDCCKSEPAVLVARIGAFPRLPKSKRPERTPGEGMARGGVVE